MRSIRARRHGDRSLLFSFPCFARSPKFGRRSTHPQKCGAQINTIAPHSSTIVDAVNRHWSSGELSGPPDFKSSVYRRLDKPGNTTFAREASRRTAFCIHRCCDPEGAKERCRPLGGAKEVNNPGQRLKKSPRFQQLTNWLRGKGVDSPGSPPSVPAWRREFHQEFSHKQRLLESLGGWCG